MADEDLDAAISYKALERGADVLSADGTRLGTVDQVLDNEREHIFDGIVVATPEGRRFVDAPEVDRITVGAVILSIDAGQAIALPEYRPGAPEYHADPRAGRLARFLGGGWRRRR